jgi:YjbE family integral membrane protein
MSAAEFMTALGIIIMIDLILGGDNALVIALATRNLPKHQRNKAIIFGTGMAILIRALFTIIAVWLLTIKFLMLIGGLFLIWIAIKLLLNNSSPEHLSVDAKAYTLPAAIKTIVVADIVMGVDNVLAVAGAAKGHFILVVLGLLISIPIIIFGSKLILVLLEKYPLLVYLGAGVLAYTAGSMITHDPSLANVMYEEAYLKWVIPIFVILLVISTGIIKNLKLDRESKKNVVSS